MLIAPPSRSVLRRSAPASRATTASWPEDHKNFASARTPEQARISVSNAPQPNDVANTLRRMLRIWRPSRALMEALDFAKGKLFQMREGDHGRLFNHSVDSQRRLIRAYIRNSEVAKNDLFFDSRDAIRKFVSNTRASSLNGTLFAP